MAELIYLDLKSTTPLQLYFETKLKGVEEEFMMAFVLGGYSDTDLDIMNAQLRSMSKSEDGGLSIIEEIATKLELLKEFDIIKQKALKRLS